MILVEARIHGRDLALPEGAVKRVVDRLGGDAEPRRRGAVDDQPACESFVLLVAVDIEQAAHGFKFFQHARRPDEQILDVVALQRVLDTGRCSRGRRRASPAPAAYRA